MDLQTMLKRQIETLDTSQKSIAIDWRNAMPAAGAVETVESRLSELGRGQERGVKFFTHDPARFTKLLDVLKVPDGERDAWRAAAEQLRSFGPDGAPRLILDVVGLVSKPQQWRAVERMLGERRLLPSRVLVDEEAFRYMPRTVDDNTSVKVVRVADCDAAAKGVEDFASSGALILTANGRAPDERWAVPTLFRTGRLPDGDDAWALETVPAGAIESFVQGLPLPVPAKPEVDLGELLETLPQETQEEYLLLHTAQDGTFSSRPGVPASGRVDAARERRLRLELGDPKVALPDLSWRARLELGRRWGIPVAASEAEQAMVARRLALNELQTEPVTATPETLQKRLERARRRPEPCAAILVDRVLHVINPTKPVQAGPFVQVHEVVADRPLISVFAEELSRWTADDWDLDPDLSALTERLLADGAELKLLLHARASARLRLHPAEYPVGAPVEDVMSALARVFSQDPPAAVLRPQGSGWSPYCSIDSVTRRSGAVPWDLLLVQCRVHPSIRRNTPYQLLGDRTPPSSVVKLPSSGGVDAWLDAVDRSLWLSGANVLGHLADVDRALNSLPNVKVDPATWESADELVAALWMAVRSALSMPEFVRMHDGSCLLRIGDGLCLRVRGVRRATDAPTVVAVLPVASFHGGRVGDPVLRQVAVAQVRGSHLEAAVGPDVPEWIRVSLGTEVLELVPTASPWGGAGRAVL